MRSISVVIADREPRRVATCRALLRGARGIRLADTVATVPAALEAAAQRPDVLLLDIRMTRETPAVPLIRASSPQTQILLLTGRASDAEVLDAIAQGARGYLGATLLRRFLPKAVRAMAAGESWVSRAMVSKLIDRLARLESR